MPMYPLLLLLSMLIMAIEKWLWPSTWLFCLWMILFIVGCLMMAFQGLRINRGAFRNPTAPLFVLDEPEEAGNTAPTPPKNGLKLVK